MSTFFYFCAYFGILVLGLKALKFLSGLRSLLRGKQNLYRKYGSCDKKSWAVITGATDGIGKGFAFVLSDYGFNICLISRTITKLDMTEEEIKMRNPNVEVASIQADFTAGNNVAFYEYIVDRLKGLDIALLVNNVGIRDTGPLEFTEAQDVVDIITVNCFPQALMTQFLFNQLLKRKERSAIINVSSFRAVAPFPWRTMYSSTKVFNYYHSMATSMELESKTDVLCLRPLYVSTNLTARRKGAGVINNQECAEGCLRHLGYETLTYGHWKHQLQGWLLGSLVQIDWLFEPLWRRIGKKSVLKDSERYQAFLKKRN